MSYSVSEWDGKPGVAIILPLVPHDWVHLPNSLHPQSRWMGGCTLASEARSSVASLLPCPPGLLPCLYCVLVALISSTITHSHAWHWLTPQSSQGGSPPSPQISHVGSLHTSATATSKIECELVGTDGDIAFNIFTKKRCHQRSMAQALQHCQYLIRQF